MPAVPPATEPAPLADAHLSALLHYTGGFYTAAMEHGMPAGSTANAVAHVERAARALHKLAAPAIEDRAQGAAIRPAVEPAALREALTELLDALANEQLVGIAVRKKHEAPANLRPGNSYSYTMTIPDPDIEAATNRTFRATMAARAALAVPAVSPEPLRKRIMALHRLSTRYDLDDPDRDWIDRNEVLALLAVPAVSVPSKGE